MGEVWILFRHWFKKKGEKKSKQETTMPDLLHLAKKSGDFKHFQIMDGPEPFWVSYIDTLVDDDTLHRDVLDHLQMADFHSLQDLSQSIPIEDITVTADIDAIQNKLYFGYVLIQFHEYDAQCALINVLKKEHRQVKASEMEFSVLGPRTAFVEDLSINLNLLRQQLPLPQLVCKELLIGKLSKTKVIVAYIDGIANEENLNTMVQRLEDVEFDMISDSSFLQKMISDNTNTIFPTYLNSEKPDKVAYMLGLGKIAVLSEGAPTAFLAPTNFYEAFTAREDYFMPWLLATGFRLIRYFSVLFSALITSLYVAVMTYHYEMVPKDLLPTLIGSRASVPISPLLEGLFLELTIELLREAGARLPTKVGQTLGIVGGIVIGQAAVAAGMTSNILLILVALAALASFTTPIYKMANTIRMLRFPFIILAGLWGGLGVVFCFSFLLIHLIHLTSLGRPYLFPFFPTRPKAVMTTFIMPPMRKMSRRTKFEQAQDRGRFNKKRAEKKHDIDE